MYVDTILHKIQTLFLFSFLSAFHLSHIDECRDSILTRSWPDMLEDCKAEGSLKWKVFV